MGIAADRLLRTMTQISNESAGAIKSDMYSGTVTSISPLKITYMAAESKEVTLTSSLLVLPFTCKAKTITVQGETVQLWGDLAVGEKVILTSFNSGNRFFVERAG